MEDGRSILDVPATDLRPEHGPLHDAVAVMTALGLRPVSLPGADVSLLLRGLSLPVTIGRPIVSRAIAGEVPA